MTRPTRLARREGPLSGVRRIMHSELVGIGEALTDGVVEQTELVHRLRVRIKRARAQLRLLRPVLERSSWQSLDAGLRELARHLAPSRDATVLLTTLDEIGREARVPAPVCEHVRRRLGINQIQVLADVELLANDAKRLAASFAPGGALHDAIPAFVASRSWQRKLFLRELRRTYRAGRRKLRAIETMAERASALHDFRKQVKYHAHQLLLLPPDKHLRKRGERLAHLGSLLGAHHDLSELEQRVVVTLSPGELSTLLPALLRRKTQIERKALQLAERLYARKPRRFLRWLVAHSDPL